ncbi:hypothetical protein HQ533_00145 [Candidatus Woesearchaeota archaeon]|nr:hypothetical protein [Candidatus Woesearchaeota archaeon]
MENILTLNKINKSDAEIVGFRAVDLAELFEKKLTIPICFVIRTSLFENFVETNNIKPEIANILKEINYSNDESLEETYQKIKDLFLKHEFSEAEQAELVEAYETLAIDIDHIDIAKLVTTIDKPYLTVIGSPNYIDDSENNDAIVQNAKGKNALFKAIKHCWIGLYTPKALKYRHNNDIKTDEKMAIIIQRLIDADISAQTYTDEEEVIVKTFIGFQDYHEEFEKDITIFSKGNLVIKNTKVNFQEYQYVRDMKDSNLVKKALKEDGKSQKLNDKDAEELARLSKRIEGFMEKPIKAFFSIAKGKIYLLFANRVIRTKKDEVEEEVIEEEPTPSLEEISKEPVESVVEPESDLGEVSIEDDLKALDEIEEQEEQTPVTEPEGVPEKTADVQEPETSSMPEEQPVSEPVKQDAGFDWGAETEEKDKLQAVPEEVSETPVQEPVVEEDTPVTEDIPVQEPVVEEKAPEEVKEPVTEPEEAQVTETPETMPEQEEAPVTKTPEPPIPEQEENAQEEEPVPIEDIEEEKDEEEHIIKSKNEDDDFIFSNFEKREDTESKDSELSETESSDHDQKLEVSDTQAEPEKPVEEKEQEAAPEPQLEAKEPEDEEGDKFEEALGLVNKQIILSDEAIFEALKKKHKEVLGKEATSFSNAIQDLKDTVRIPFIDEIKKVHHARRMVEKGEKVDVEEATKTMRTAKNFLKLFT